MLEEEQEACNRLVDELRQMHAGTTPFTFPKHAATRPDATPHSIASQARARDPEFGTPSVLETRSGRRRSSVRQGMQSPHMGGPTRMPSCMSWDSLLGDEPHPHRSTGTDDLHRRDGGFGTPLRTPLAPLLPGRAGNWDMGAALACTPEGRSYAQKTIEAERAAISNLLDGVLEQKRAAEQARDAAVARADAAEAQLAELERHFQDVEEAWGAACERLEQERIGAAALGQGGLGVHPQLGQGEDGPQPWVPAGVAADLQHQIIDMEVRIL
jgi:hypothetical protein